MKLLPPLRFRFAEDDRETYGDGWTVYDESAIARLPARELIEIERQIGMSVATMIVRARANMTDANLAAMWLSCRLAGSDRPFAGFEPLVLLTEWEPVLAADADPPALDSSTSPSTE